MVDDVRRGGLHRLHHPRCAALRRPRARHHRAEGRRRRTSHRDAGRASRHARHERHREYEHGGGAGRLAAGLGRFVTALVSSL